MIMGFHQYTYQDREYVIWAMNTKHAQCTPLLTVDRDLHQNQPKPAPRKGMVWARESGCHALGIIML